MININNYKYNTYHFLSKIIKREKAWDLLTINIK